MMLTKDQIDNMHFEIARSLNFANDKSMRNSKQIVCLPLQQADDGSLHTESCIRVCAVCAIDFVNTDFSVGSMVVVKFDPK